MKLMIHHYLMFQHVFYVFGRVLHTLRRVHRYPLPTRGKEEGRLTDLICNTREKRDAKDPPSLLNGYVGSTFVGPSHQEKSVAPASSNRKLYSGIFLFHQVQSNSPFVLIFRPFTLRLG